MSKKKKKSPHGEETRLIRERLLSDKTLKNSEIAKELGVPVSNVSTVRSRLNRRIENQRNFEKIPNEERTKHRKPLVDLTIGVSNGEDYIQIRLVDAQGHLTRVASFSQKGVNYRKPNSKKHYNRFLTWDNLDKILQLGLVAKEQ